MNITMSASCSMAPDSRRSLNCGILLPSLRVSTARLNCDSAMIGTSTPSPVFLGYVKWY